jgi:hypothetical protein
MRAVVGRRVFVGSVAAGLPLIMGAGARPLAQSGAAGAAHSHPGLAGADPLQEHLIREMARVYNRMRRGPTGEDARAFAMHLRTLAVHGRQHDLDTQLRAAAAEAISKEGRDIFLQREPDAGAMRAELERYGFSLDERTRHVTLPHDPRRRNIAVDTLLNEGVTGTWDRLAAFLEQAAPAIDRRNGSIVRVGLVGQDAAYWVGFCSGLWAHYQEAQLLATAGCALVAIPFVGVIFSASCVALQGGAAVSLLMYVLYGCA